VTKAGRGKGARGQAAAETDDRTPTERRAAMTWAQRLKRVFGIDIETCSVCGGAVRIIACIEDPVVIEKILAHLDAKAAAAQAARPPPCRAPPARPLARPNPPKGAETRGRNYAFSAPVSRADLAVFMLKQLADNTFRNEAPRVMY
jgi:pyruvate/2-oxoglutarate dehydrogenase complex dihydrolipoamide acyltransferase (E2) component